MNLEYTENPQEIQGDIETENKIEIETGICILGEIVGLDAFIVRLVYKLIVADSDRYDSSHSQSSSKEEYKPKVELKYINEKGETMDEKEVIMYLFASQTGQAHSTL